MNQKADTITPHNLKENGFEEVWYYPTSWSDKPNPISEGSEPKESNINFNGLTLKKNKNCVVDGYLNGWFNPELGILLIPNGTGYLPKAWPPVNMVIPKRQEDEYGEMISDLDGFMDLLDSVRQARSKK